MPTLSQYANVYNTALIVLANKGYQLWYDKKADLYCAEKDGWDFMADDPCGLLGVVAIFEHKNPSAYAEYWWRERDPDLYRNLPDAPERPYESVMKKK